MCINKLQGEIWLEKGQKVMIVSKIQKEDCVFDGKGWKIINDFITIKIKKFDGHEFIRIRAHRMCVHQTLAPEIPSNPGMPTSPYGQHNIQKVAAFSIQQCELLISGQEIQKA